ncbi:MAG: HAD-IC family P-type ATPase [Candidatus Pacebacteria bacterium]|nr:HAD-IC family P-type ATPase [Candidatus Paceibacterota bacterium]
MNFYSKKSEEVIESLSSNISGLTDSQVRERIEKYGFNEIPSGEEKGPVFIFFKQFHSILIYILFVAAFIAFIFNHLIDVYVIFAVILINAVMGFIQEYKAEKAIAALKTMIVPHAKVFRNGELLQIDARDLVPGDIIFIEEGDKIPADGRLLEVKNFRTQEASLTGESFPVSKDIEPLSFSTGISDRKNMIFMGTFAAGGWAKAIVVSTGIHTVIGEIAKSMKEIKRAKGHFEKKTDKLAKQMGLIAASLALFTFLIGFFLRDIEFEEIFLFTIASLVSGIPEGLPAILVIVLAVGVSRMARKNAIIRRLSATETLGVVNVIATDKTGTLTQNTMNIEQIIMDKEDNISVSGDGWIPKGEFRQGNNIIFPLEKPNLAKLLRIASVCNNARLIKEEEGYKILGDPTEASLVVLGEKAGLKKEVIQEREKRIDDIPFNSQLKFRASLSILKDEKERKEIYVIGAPEAILSRSSYCLEQSKIKKFSDKKKNEIIKRTEDLTKKSMRVIALAYKIAGTEINSLSEEMADDLIFVGVVGMIDPPRKGVKEAIEKAKKAGIRVLMITGDHRETALAIAREIGLVERNEEKAYVEQDLLKMTDSQFERAVKEVSVFARLTPSIKLKIAETLQKQGNVIAMTGDGVNDALAIKKADIGIAMGIIGTDVARESAEIVLADDNFASIVSAVEEGRVVFTNTRQSSAFLITTNFAEDASIIGTLLLGLPLPLLPTQILWLNLVTDSIPAASLAVEPGHGEVLEEPPRKEKEDILSKEIIPFLIVMVLTMFLSVLLIFKFFLPEGLDKARTGVFLVMAFTQLFNAVNMRSLRKSIFEIGLFSNIYFAIGIIFSFILQIAVMYIPFFQNIFSFYSLSFLEFIAVLIISSFVLWFGELYKEMRKKWTEKK